jgi:hypothetical protein
MRRRPASASKRWKSGLSATFSRMTRPTLTRTTLSRNGMRQPHAKNCSSGSSVAAATAPAASIDPAGAPRFAKDAANPRLPPGACSRAMSMAPPHSPPTASPCRIRNTISRTGATAPTWAVVGSRPMTVVAIPMVTIDVTSTPLRPIRSPKWPKIAPPSGRATYPAARVPNDANVASAGLRAVKNTSEKTTAAAVAYSMKS